MIVTMQPDQTKTATTAQNTLGGPVFVLANDGCPDVKAAYLLIGKVLCISSILSWFLVACPLAVADESPVMALDAAAFSHSYDAIEANFGSIAPSAGQNGFSWQRYSDSKFQSADGLHEGVKQLRQALSSWWASKPQQSAITTQVKSMMAASGDGPYAAWSYNIGASSKSLELNIRYEF